MVSVLDSPAAYKPCCPWLCLCGLAVGPARRLSVCVPVRTELALPGPCGGVFSLPCVPCRRPPPQASHPEQHQHLQVLPEHRHGGAERTLQQAVRPLQVVAVPQDEDRVEVQRLPGPVPHPGERGPGAQDGETQAGPSREKVGIRRVRRGCRPRGEMPCWLVSFEAGALTGRSICGLRMQTLFFPNGSWAERVFTLCQEPTGCRERCILHAWEPWQAH